MGLQLIAPTANQLKDVSLSADQGGTSLLSSVYSLIPGDLRAFDELHAKLQSILDPEIPTLILAECVFIYMGTKCSSDVLKWFAQGYSKAGLACLLYDPVGLDDSFGRVMINNLQVR